MNTSDHHHLYTSARWRKARKGFLANHPICSHCKAKNRIKVATVVDHVEPYKGNMVLFWDQDNWQAVCKYHHDYKTATQDNPKAFGYFSKLPAWIDPPAIPVKLLCGPSGAGKKSYAERKKEKGAVVIDLDYIIADLPEQPLYYPSGREWYARAMVERNKRLADLSTAWATNYTEAWLITAAPKAADSKLWRAVLNTDHTVVLERDPFQCGERIAKEKRGDPRLYSGYAKRWWKQYVAAPHTETIISYG